MRTGFTILLIILLTWSFNCTTFETEESEKTKIEDFPDQESWNARMYFTKDGKRKAVLNAGYIAKYSKKSITLLKEDVKVDFYDNEGNHKSVLTSLEGKVFDKSQDMVAIGNVVVKSDNGNHLYCEELHWNNKTQKIISNVPVKITTKEDTLFGDTLISDPDLSDYELTNTHGTSQKTISIDD